MKNKNTLVASIEQFELELTLRPVSQQALLAKL